MDKSSKHIIGLLFCVFLVSAAYNIRISSARQGQTYGDGTDLFYSVQNRGTENIKNARATLWIPDADYYEGLGTLSIKSHKTQSSVVTPDLSGVAPGEYLSRVRVSNNHASSSRWVWINVE